jgi:methylmalonyl-CoA mutase N-terminal domain/subunit
MIGSGERKFSTTSDIEIGNLYAPDSVSDTKYQKDLGRPGEHPFTRGRLWTMRQYAGFGTAEETNKKL